MQMEDYFDFLDADDIRLRGTRVGIETVLYDYLFRALTPEEIQQTYPHLTLEQVYATILYYLRHRQAVSGYLSDSLEFGRAARAEQERTPSAARSRLREMRRAPAA